MSFSYSQYPCNGSQALYDIPLISSPTFSSHLFQSLQLFFFPSVHQMCQACYILEQFFLYLPLSFLQVCAQIKLHYEPTCSAHPLSYSSLLDLSPHTCSTWPFSFSHTRNHLPTCCIIIMFIVLFSDHPRFLLECKLHEIWDPFVLFTHS